MIDARQIAAALAAPFEAGEVKFKPQSVKGNRCLAMAYVSARTIMDRLDEVLGVGEWQDSYDVLADGSVVCRLAVRIAGEWTTKTDVGSPSEQPDGGDRLKAAFSDALKRAAVKYGVGRYLYRLASQWVDFDPVKKQIVRLPQLPAFATPANGKSRTATKRLANSRAPAAESSDLLPEPAPVNDDDMAVMWIDSARDAIRKAATIAELMAAWNAMTPEVQGYVLADKNTRKTELAAAGN